MADVVGEARALLDRWSLETWGARREAGKSLDIRAAEAVGPLQVILRTKYERRWVELQYRRAAPRPEGRHAPDAPLPPLDLWEVPCASPKDGSAFQDVIEVPQASGVVACPECSGGGRTTCTVCGGRGTVQRHSSSGRSSTETCSLCSGQGEITCPTCGGSGATTATPLVHVECGTAEQVQVVEGAELPTSVYLALQEATGGACVYEEGAPGRLEPRFAAAGEGGGAYRGEVGRHSPRANEAVNRLLSQEPVEGQHQVYGQEVRVLQVAAFRVDPTRGDPLWVFGDPPKVWPDGVLRGAVWWARRLAPWAIGVAAVAAVALAAALAGGR